MKKRELEKEKLEIIKGIKFDKTFLSFLEVGIKVGDDRKLSVHQIFYHKKCDLYLIHSYNLNSYIKLDKKTFDRAFKGMEQI